MNSIERLPNIGLLGLGLDTYWDQFPDLRQRLLGYIGDVERKICADTRNVINLGLIDTAEKAMEAGHACRQNDIDILVVYVTTYALSSTLLPVVRRANVPVLLLNLQPSAAIKYSSFNRLADRTAMTSEWLAYCGSCPVPEIANVLKRLGIRFHEVTGLLQDDPSCWAEIDQWLRAVEVTHALSHSRLGLMGHYYSGMLDIATDLALVSGRFGIHIEHLEVDELTSLRRQATEQAVELKQRQFLDFFRIEEDCPAQELARAARTAVALDLLVEKHQLQLMAYYYKGTGIPENESTISSIILGASMLTGSHVPIAGEYEVKNAVAMKVMDLLGVGGSFTEYYAMDYKDDLVLMGHDGPGHIGIAEDKIKVRPLEVYHGKVGSGLSVEMSVRCGPVTLLSVVEDPERGYLFLTAEGDSVSGPILELGNTNSRYRFPAGARRFVQNWNAHGPAHHCAIGVGHVGEQLHKVAELLGLGFAKVC